jgi:hypothetical protein
MYHILEGLDETICWFRCAFDPKLRQVRDMPEYVIRNLVCWPICSFEDPVAVRVLVKKDVNQYSIEKSLIRVQNSLVVSPPNVRLLPAECDRYAFFSGKYNILRSLEDSLGQRFPNFKLHSFRVQSLVNLIDRDLGKNLGIENLFLHPLVATMSTNILKEKRKNNGVMLASYVISTEKHVVRERLDSISKHDIDSNMRILGPICGGLRYFGEDPNDVLVKSFENLLGQNFPSKRVKKIIHHEFNEFNFTVEEVVISDRTIRLIPPKGKIPERPKGSGNSGLERSNSFAEQ